MIEEETDVNDRQARTLADLYMNQIGEIHGSGSRDAYLNGMSRRICKTPLDELNRREWAKILAALS